MFHEAKVLEACKLEIEAIEILVASESDVRHWQPSVLVLHGVSGACEAKVLEACNLEFGAIGSSHVKSDVRHWQPSVEGPVRP